MIEMRLCLVSLSRMCVSYYDWFGIMQTSDEFEEVQYKNVNRLYSTEWVGREKNQNKKRWVMYFSSDHQSPYQTFTYEWFSSWTLIIFNISYNILVIFSWFLEVTIFSIILSRSMLTTLLYIANEILK